MRELIDHLHRWHQRGTPIALATVVSTSNSAPRLPGAVMAVDPSGAVVGSVSGGCVEGAVYETAQRVLDSGQPVLESYGYSDDEAFAVGLTCGGTIELWTERVDLGSSADFARVLEDISSGRAVAVATVIEHPDPAVVGRRLVVRPEAHDNHHEQSLGSSRRDAAVRTDALGMLANGASGSLTYGPDGQRRGCGMRVFVSSLAVRPRMLVFGAIDFAAAVSRIGSFLGYRVTVCDARPVFATTARFPDADEVVVEWPHRYLATQEVDARTVICVLTHDPKFDVPLLEVALRLPEVAYIGAMGSRRTHDDRLTRLREAGLTDEELDRLSSPIGLDHGAPTPEETAVSIAAEIVALQWGGGGMRLQETGGAIHHHATAEAHQA